LRLVCDRLVKSRRHGRGLGQSYRSGGMAKTRITKEFHKNFDYRYDKLTAVANTRLFQDFINPTDSVLHFWCGGGYLLNSLACGDKYGVDANPKYRDHAQTKFGFRVAPNLDGFQNLDVVISSHTLARLPNPLQTLSDAYKILRDGGALVVVVPCYSHKNKYTEFNFEQHLYSWSPIDIGNLVHRVGFSILSVERICHRIPPKGGLVLKYGGEKLFHLACKIYGWVSPRQTQIRVVGLKMPRREREELAS
jgi:SAM-dependent methyltransferase